MFLMTVLVLGCFAAKDFDNRPRSVFAAGSLLGHRGRDEAARILEHGLEALVHREVHVSRIAALRLNTRNKEMQRQTNMDYSNVSEYS